jgi:hypothetical protein
LSSKSRAASNPSQGHSTDGQPPLKLTLEEKTPAARWIVLTVLALFACSVLTYLINAGNPKITASDLEAMGARPTPTTTIVVNEAGYSAMLNLNPSDQVPTDSNLTLTSTLYLHGKPVPHAKVHFTFTNTRGVLQDVDGGVTGPDGASVTVYNIGRVYGHFSTRVVAAFIVDGKAVIRTDTRFTPVPAP